MADIPFQMHYPDEFDPTISFAPVWNPDGRGDRSMGPSMFEFIRRASPNWIYNEAADNDTVYIYDRSNVITEDHDFFFFPLAESQLVLLDLFLRATRGRAFRMIDPISREYITVIVAQGGYPSERTYQYGTVRVSDGEIETHGWRVPMVVRVLD